MKIPTRFALSYSCSCFALALLALGVVSPAFAQSNIFPTTGNAGVGTTTPTSLLDIAYNPDPVVRIRNTGSGIGAYFSPNTLNDFTITGQGGSNLFFGAGNAQLFLKYADSTIGLGTKTPGARAEVFGITGGYFPVLRLNTNYSGAAPVDLNPFITGVSNSGFELRMGGTTRLAVNSAGNVGIGTTSPASRLHLADVGYLQFNPNDGAIEIGSGNDGFSFLDFRGNTHLGEDYWGRLGYLDSGGFSLTSRSSSSTVLSTSTPGVNNYIVLNSGVAENSYGELSFEGVGTFAGNMYIGGAAAGKIVLRSGGYTPRLVVDNSGNVGIGTSAPTHKLSVNGSVRAKEVIVETTGWADYVFAPGYDLPTLAETEQHIAEHGHLPGIPSANEVAEQGVSVGDLQVKLLQKLEEMTLHQIEMQKEIKQLRSELATLKGDGVSR